MKVISMSLGLIYAIAACAAPARNFARVIHVTSAYYYSSDTQLQVDVTTDISQYCNHRSACIVSAKDIPLVADESIDDWNLYIFYKCQKYIQPTSLNTLHKLIINALSSSGVIC